MPIPEERMHNAIRLNRWFAVSSVLMTGSLLWMIYVDYQRPWIEPQDQYFVNKAALVHLEYLDAIRSERREEIELRRQRLRDARELDAIENAAARAELEKKLAEANLEFRKSDAPWSMLNQVIQVTSDTYERELSAQGPDHPGTRAAKAQLDQETDRLALLQERKEHWEDGKKELQRDLRILGEQVQSAEDELLSLEEVAEEALQKDQNYRGVLTDEGLLGRIPVVSSIINAPLLDFTAPKNTPGRRQVNQLVLPNIRQQLNYMETYTTDRCITCHVAINAPEFSRAQFAQKLERSLPAINEELQRLGHSPLDWPPPPILEEPETAPLRVGHVTDHWNQLTPEAQEAYFDGLLERVNSYFELVGRKTIRLEHPILAHPLLDLFVSVDSPHPMAKIGCTVCHAGNPQETDFVLAAHSAPTHEIEERWAEEYYTRNLGIPTATFELVAHYWDRPMHVPEHTQAGCVKCHSEIADIARFDGERVGVRINLGRYLFTNLGCINCHNVDALAGSRRVGPDLTHIASKLTPEFAQQWIFFPKKFRPSTLMPHFFLQENNRPQSANAHDPDPVLRTETEVAAITKYLMAVSQVWEPFAKPEAVTGDAARGRELFKQVGCLGCHANLAEYGEEWITQDIAQQERIDWQTANHRYKGMTYEEGVRYAMKHFGDDRDTFLRPEAVRSDPEDPYNTPTLSRFAPELSGIGSKVTFEWLYSWLIEPTHYSSDTKMPSLRLTPAETADVTAYLMTLKNERFVQGEFGMNDERQQMADDLIFILLSAQRSARTSRAIMNDTGGDLTKMLVSMLKPSLGPEPAQKLIEPMAIEDKKLMFLGNKMIAHYGCYTCHLIPTFEGASPPGTDLSTWAEKPVSQLDFAFYGTAFHGMREKKEEVFGHVYPLDAHELIYWSLGENPREQITHTHAAFANHKMLNPRIWDRQKMKRPYDKLKMPNYYFTEEEATALTTFLMSRTSPLVNQVVRVDYEGGLAGPIARGRHLTRELNCVSCHQIEDNVPTIQQYFRITVGGELVFDETNAPPILWGEGAKVQHSWLHSFLEHVEPLRPWLTVRMPSFNLTNEQRTTLVEYFAALSQSDAGKLDNWLARVDEHIASAPTSASDTTPEAKDWYQDESLRTMAQRIRRFGIERKLIRPFELDPLRSSPDRVRAAHAKLRERTRFLQELYDVEYPFVESARPLSKDERFDMGMRLLNDMGCLKCHVLGEMLPGPATITDDFVQMYRLDGVRGEGEDAVAMLNGEPYAVGSVIDGFTLISAANTYYDTGDVETKAVVEGPNAEGETERIVLQAPSAPNLALTQQRLRRAWVLEWMFQPSWIQPGTKMPQNFPDERSPFEGDPNYPGTGLDHVNLLVDTIYEAGTRGVRSPLVKSVVTEDTGEFDEEGEFFDEEFDD